MLSSAGWPKAAMQTARSHPRMPRSCGRPLQEYGDLTIVPADMTQEQVDAIRTQAGDLLTVIDAIPTDTLPEEQKQRLQEARAHIAAIADAADPAAMRDGAAERR